MEKRTGTNGPFSNVSKAYFEAHNFKTLDVLSLNFELWASEKGVNGITLFFYNNPYLPEIKKNVCYMCRRAYENIIFV